MEAKPTLPYWRLSCCIFVYVAVFCVFQVHASSEGIRLKYSFGSAPNKGRVEVQYGGVWGTICDDKWGLADAEVVCRQLGFAGALRALPRAYYGPGDLDTVIWLDEVSCVGNESRIQDCPSDGWGQHNCQHLEDASVECLPGNVRLVGGSDIYEGNVQVINDNGTAWGYVCDNDWDSLDAAVACRDYDDRGVSITTYNSTYETEAGEFFLGALDCNGFEDTLEDCPRTIGSGSDEEGVSCAQSDKAGVVCVGDPYEEGEVRLVGTGDATRGRVEIYHAGVWGTICDDYWDYYDAQVVCRQLGFTNVQPKAYYGSYFGAGSGQIWLDNVNCLGSESSLDKCLAPYGWGVHNCNHMEDAGVYCDQRGVFDAAEITGIVLASLFALGIVFCCVKYIFCEAANNKRDRRRRHVRRQRSRPATTPATTTPEEHFDAHFNDAFTISGEQDENGVPHGFAYPPPFGPGVMPPPFSPSDVAAFSPTDLPPSYEDIMSAETPTGISTSGATQSGANIAAAAAATDGNVDTGGAVALGSPAGLTGVSGAAAQADADASNPSAPQSSNATLPYPPANPSPAPSLTPIETTTPPLPPSASSHTHEDKPQSNTLPYPTEDTFPTKPSISQTLPSTSNTEKVDDSGVREDANITFVACASAHEDNFVDLAVEESESDRLSDA